jgi:MFS family permease
MWTIFMVSLLQMAGMAISPALNQMKTVAFPQYSLFAIQTVLAISSLTMPCVSLLSAAAIRRGFITKRSTVAVGLFALGLAGLLSLILNKALWQLGVLSAITGFGSGCYLTTAISIMMDRFEPTERRRISGHQAVFVNMGAILAGLLGGFLAAWQWYGGYLVFVAGIPMGVLALILLPRENRTKAARSDAPKQAFKVKPIIFYYAAIVIVFMLAFAVIGGNLAVHMAESGINNPAVVGALTSFQMVGGALFGFIFGRFSAKFKDYTLVIAFFLLFAGLTILSVFHASLICAFIGVFLTGISITMIGPQCIFSSSNHVDTHSSALASSLVSGLAPGLGGFLSPIIFTNLTDALVKDSTNFRYQFVAFFALACAVAVAGITYVRSKRNRESLAKAVCEELS